MKLLRFFEFVQEWDDSTLVKGLQKKDRKAESYFYEKFSKLLYFLVKKLSKKLDDESINIIVNNAITRSIKQIDKFEFKGSLEGWVRKIGTHAFYDYIKANQKESGVIYKGDVPEKNYNPEQSDLEKQIKAKFDMFKKQLTPLQIKVISMYLDGYKHKEISQECGFSEPTSKWHVGTILSKFRDWYNKNKNI